MFSNRENLNHCENAVFFKCEEVKVNLCENAVFPKFEKVKVNLCEDKMSPNLESGTGGVEG